MIMASIRKRNGKYQVQVRVRGKGTSATFQTLDHARRWARKIELEFERSIKVGKSYQPKTLLEILDPYKEVVIPLYKHSLINYYSYFNCVQTYMSICLSISI